MRWINKTLENKFLPRTVLRSFLHKLERNLMYIVLLAGVPGVA